MIFILLIYVFIMPNFVADIWRVTTHLSREIHLSLRAGMNAPLKRADRNLSGRYVATNQPFPPPLEIQPFLLLKG